MRLTDDRYRRDRMRLELAMRLIRHEARTQTIRRWTGLSDDRIRKLFRSYIRPGSGVRRHRGKSPQQVGYFLRAGSTGADAHALASVLLLFGVLPAKPDPSLARRLPSIPRGRLLCDAYEAYRRVSPKPRIDFEHAVFLALALAASDEIRIQWCPHCEALNLVECVVLQEGDCRACGEPLYIKPAVPNGRRTTPVAARISGAPQH